MKKIATLLGLLCLVCFNLKAQTTIASGEWHNPAIWDTGVVPTGGTITIASGHTIYIHGARSTSSIADLNVYGSLIFEKVGNVKASLVLPSNSTIKLYTGSNIGTQGGGTGSNFLQIGGNWINGSKLDAVVEPNTLTEDNLSTGGECPGTGCEPGGVVLPVELMYYNASRSFNGALLNWATASEVNFSHYEIQYSTNGNNFSVVGEVSGTGSETSQATYQFVFNNLVPGYNYFKLVAVDIDGSREVHGIKAVKVGEVAMLSPNPARQSDVRLYLENDKQGIVKIYTVNGSLVHQQALTNNFTLLPTANLKAGTYIVRVAGNTNHSTQKLIIQ